MISSHGRSLDTHPFWKSCNQPVPPDTHISHFPDPWIIVSLDARGTRFGWGLEMTDVRPKIDRHPYID